jgi:DHA1 family multidrug resistance protein-like MFS transporter
MNDEDLRQVDNERDASPDRFEEYEEQYLEKEREDFARQEDQIIHDAEHHHHHHSHRPHNPGASTSYAATHDTRASRTSSSAASSGVQYEALGGTGHEQFRRTLTRSATATSKINHLEQHPTAIERIQTHRTQHETTVGTGATPARTHSSTLSKPLPNFGAGKPYPKMLPASEEYVVEFDGPDDPLHAQNWPSGKKLRVGVPVAFFSLAATIASSIFSNATSVIDTDYHVGQEVGTLATSLFVLGYAFGP